MDALIKNLIYDGVPFFDGEGFIIDNFKRQYLLMEDRDTFPGTKLDIVMGVFEALNIDQFLLITGDIKQPIPNLKDMGKVALVFSNYNLTEQELEEFADMIYHRLPVSIWLRCFIFLPAEYQKYIEYTRLLEEK